VVPIPTEPIPVVVITVPPVPTVILSPAVSNPLSKVNLVSVEKSPEPLNKISVSLPGAKTVIVDPIDVVPIIPYCSALIIEPLKLSWVTLL